MFYKLWKGYQNNQGDPYGCPEDGMPNCVQQHQPIGSVNMRVESDFEEVGFCQMLSRLEQKYHKGSECLKVGDEIGIMLVPSFSKLEDVVIDVTGTEPGFLFDIVLDDRMNAQAPIEGEVLRATYPTPTDADDDDGCCKSEILGVGTAVDMGGEDSRTTDWFCIDPKKRIGCAAGIIKIVIKSLPEKGLTGCANFKVRANYHNAYSCCHSADCGCPSDC